MNNQIQLTIIIFLTFVGFNLNAQTSDVKVGCKPLTVKFVAPSGSASYYWDFKDGVTSVLENPQNTFRNTGEYEVEFRESEGGVLIGTIKIKILEPLDLMIKAIPEKGCVGKTIMMIDSTKYPDEIINAVNLWEFGDGLTENGSSVTHSYSSEGIYNVSLNVKTSLANCDATKIFTNFISIDKSPTPLFTTDPVSTISCESPLDVSFFNKTPNLNANTYEWDMGNGNKYTTINPDDQTFAAGTYSVKLTAISPNGCSASASKTVVAGPPIPKFIVPDSVCINTDVQLFDKTIGNGNQSWDFGPDVTPSTSTSTLPVVIFTKGGLIPIKLTVFSLDLQCSKDTIINVFVDDPDASFVSDPNFSCEPVTEIDFTPATQDAEIYNWVFGNITGSSETNPTVIYDESDGMEEYVEHAIHGYETKLTITTTLGCIDSFTRVDTIFRPYAHFQPDLAKGCAPLEVEFKDLSISDTTIISWEYDFGDGQMQTNTTSDEFTHTFTDPGEYDVWLQIENQTGCRDTSFHMTIYVGDMQNVSFTADDTDICVGDTVRFEGHSMDPDPTEWHFDTDNSRSSHCYQDSIMEWVFQSETGMFDVNLWSEYNGCFTTDNMPDMITVKGPLAKIDYLIDCDNPNDISFRDSSEQATNVVWYFGDGDSSLVSNIVHPYAAVGDYQVILKAEGATGCGPSYDTTLVCVRNLEAVITFDDKVCYGKTYILDGSQSKDVDSRCHRGYTWVFQKNSRPITTNNDMKEFQFGIQGVDTMKLVVRDINGCLDTTSYATKVFKVEPEFTMDKTKICFPADVVFQSTSMADTLMVIDEWTFGNETTTLGPNSNPTHSFTTPVEGPITVKLRVKDILGCDATITKEIEIYEPFSSFIPKSKVICEGSTVTFLANDFTNGGSNLTFNWESNGQNSISQSPTFTYNTEGDYPVTLDFEEVSTGCSGQVVGNVTVQGFPEAAITVVGENFCVGDNGAKQIIFLNGSISNFDLSTEWDFGNGGLGTGDNVVSTYLRGDYTVKLVVSTSAGCKDSIEVPVSIIGPVGDFVMDKDSICIGEEITFMLVDTMNFGVYTWEVGGLKFDTINPLSFTYDEVRENYIIKLVFYDLKNECRVVKEKSVTIRDVMADFNRGGGDLKIQECVGEPIIFTSTSTGADIFNWDFMDGETSNDEKISHFFDAGIYEVKLSVENSEFGCTDEVEKTVIINPLPDVKALGDTICVGFPATLMVIDPNVNDYSYQWSPEDFDFDNNTNTIVQTDKFNSSGTYEATLKVTDKNTNCNNDFFVTIVVTEGIDSFEIDSIVSVGDFIIIDTPLDGFTFEWSQFRADTTALKLLDCVDCSKPKFTVPPGETKLIFEAKVSGNGCDTATWRYNYIIVKDPDYPLVFTPNNDGVNEYFYPKFEKGLAEFAIITDMRIFNRWGQKVYDNDNPGQGWDGTYKGKPQSQDVYLYIISGYFPGREDKPFMNTGDLTLLR